MFKRFTLLRILFLALFAVTPFIQALSAIGDTTVITSFQARHMSNHGNYDQQTVFPDWSVSYGKILMNYRLGCPPTGCSDWDYTTQLKARVPSGRFDSTATQHPSFTANGVALDSFPYTYTQTYEYFMDAVTGNTDSVANTLVRIYIYGDSLNPTVATDSDFVYRAGYYNYTYTAGIKTDSVWVNYTGIYQQHFWAYYNVFEVVEEFELARVMTPYANGYPLSWGRDFWYDVTDFLPVLKDTLTLRLFYDGYSDGFTGTVTFYFIEGIPARTPIRTRIIYPVKYYEYGITSNPIENHLVPVSMPVDTSEHQAKIRVIPSGHSFGGNQLNQNCAEFCAKNYYWQIDNVTRASQLVWRSDCGNNALMSQPGTWLYDRSNWCPGEKAIVRNHEITPWISPGNNVTLNMNFDAYTYFGGANFNPGYYLSTILVTYGNTNFQTNASIDEILAPNSAFDYSRTNPICDNAVVVLKNLGADTLTSCTITYGIKGGTLGTYNWTGSLKFNQTATVTLPNLAWGSTTGNANTFEAFVSSPNGTADQYNYDDTLRSGVTFTPMHPAQFAMLWRTNNYPAETTYQLTNSAGVTLYTNRPNLTAATIYRDTFNLAPGCYTLKINDSGKDGLSFWANTAAGAGYARLVNTVGSTSVIKTFNPDFGTSITYNFTVGFTTSLEEKINDALFNLSPNPTSGQVSINLVLPKAEDIKITVMNQLGQVVYTEEKQNFIQDIFNINLESYPAGMYFVTVSSDSGKLTKKVIRQ